MITEAPEGQDPFSDRGESVMPLAVVMGATLQCSCGSAPAKLVVTSQLQAKVDNQLAADPRAVCRACYQKELNHSPGIGGKLVIHFKIGGDGVVQAGNTSTASGSTMRNDTVEQCVKSNVNRLKFPAKGGIANVNYPFVFTQGG